jgi:hypothetical protein
MLTSRKAVHHSEEHSVAVPVLHSAAVTKRKENGRIEQKQESNN